MTLEEFRKGLKGYLKTLPGVQKCTSCGTPLQETVTGNRKTHRGHVCADCYFEMLGEEVERRPVFMPRSVRGA